MQQWMREAKQGTYLLESRQQHLTVSRHRSCAMQMQTKVNKPHELNISSTATKD